MALGRHGGTRAGAARSARVRRRAESGDARHRPDRREGRALRRGHPPDPRGRRRAAVDEHQPRDLLGGARGAERVRRRATSRGSTRRRTPSATACATARGTAACSRPARRGSTDGSGSRRRMASSSSIRRRSAANSARRRWWWSRSSRAGALRPERDSIALRPDQRDVQIEYTALTFLEPTNVRFRYRLDPYDADWVDVGNRRTAFYTKVPPGRYTFRVEASDAAGGWYEPGTPARRASPPASLGDARLSLGCRSRR